MCSVFSLENEQTFKVQKGHRDNVHTCDAVKVRGSEMALIKSRAAAAECDSEVNGIRSRLVHVARLCAIYLRLVAGQCSRPSPCCLVALSLHSELQPVKAT